MKFNPECRRKPVFTQHSKALTIFNFGGKLFSFYQN